jgi:hypothetical protein
MNTEKRNARKAYGNDFSSKNFLGGIMKEKQ